MRILTHGTLLRAGSTYVHFQSKSVTNLSFHTSQQAMAADYGFRAGAGRLYEDHYGEVPTSVVELVSEVCLYPSFCDVLGQ